MHTTIYTDGACIGNPGRGGYAAVILSHEGRKEISGGYRLTTNNRMEMFAAIVALEALQPGPSIKLYTDSKYLADSVERGWARKWRAQAWKKGKDKRTNWDLWDRLLNLCDQHKVELIWVRGHAGHTENERCDVLSMQAAQINDLPEDVGYIQRFNVDYKSNQLSLWSAADKQNDIRSRRNREQPPLAQQEASRVSRSPDAQLV